jgi:hypothetical protein
LLAAFAFIFFRSETVGIAFDIVLKLFSASVLSIPKIANVGRFARGSIVLSILVLIAVEWINRNEEYGFRRQSKHKVLRWLVYISITMMILELSGQGQGFIYFQF